MSGSEDEEFKPTQLRQYYEELRNFTQEEETKRAEAAARKTGGIVRKFGQSCKQVSRYPVIDEPFHPGTRKALADPPVPVPEIRKTHEFASQLDAGQTPEVLGPSKLKFRFVEREIFPLRTTLKGGPRPGRRWMDLLLKSSDGLPVVTELKIRQDRLSYFALIQSLMYAAELSSESQLNRLLSDYPKAKFEIPKKEPALDIMIITFDPPERGLYRERSFEATKDLSEKLMAEPEVGEYIRRISYITAPSEGDKLKFTTKFSFDAN